MGLHPVFGHEQVKDRITGSILSSRFPQSVLFSGPRGVGKQRLALWTAQALLCEGQAGTPCGRCPQCIQVRELTNPDVHWFVPVPTPKSGPSEKQIEEVKGALGEIMDQRRTNPLYSPPESMHGHPLAAIRLLQQKAGRTPFAGKRKVLILGEAERMVTQEASQEAANALLKVLEEPTADTNLILTSSEPRRLLPTIRSRVVLFRIPPVPSEVVKRFLTEMAGTPSREVDRVVEEAQGSIGRAISLEERGSDAAEAAARRLLDAALSEGERGKANLEPVEMSLGQPPWRARGEFSDLLEALAFEMRARLRQRLSEQCSDSEASGWVTGLKLVEDIRLKVRQNINPQIAMFLLGNGLARIRCLN